MNLSLIVPVYRNEACIPDLLRALDHLHRNMVGKFEAVFVVDGSPDRCLELLAKALPAASFRSQLLALSANFGSFAAIRAGLEHARGDLFAVMAADLQEPPELVLQFRQLLMTGEHDIVVGTRSARSDPWGKRVSSRLFWGFYRKCVQGCMPAGGVDVFACNRRFRDHLLSLRELNSTLVGLIIWMGFRRAEVSYVRQPRRHGRSAWSFWKRFRYFLDSTFAFSDLPIRLLSFIGFLGMMLSATLGATIVAFKVAGRIEIPGYTATVLTVIFFGGLNAVGLGVIGEYIWRTFQNTKGRPMYMIVHQQDYDGKESPTS